MKWLITSLVVACVSLVAVYASAQRYVGAETCKGCHPFEYERWAAGPHAKAHLSLDTGQREDAKCSTCHTTNKSIRSQVPVTSVGIGCESCHGPGQYYHPAYVMKDSELAAAVGLIKPGEAHCRRCHTEGTPSIRGFDFEVFWKEIEHGKTARERWEAEQSDTAP